MNFKLRIYNKKEKGFTLIELLLYAVLSVIIGLVLVSFFTQTIKVVETSRRSRESLDNARSALDLISLEIRNAKSFYSPTSVLGTNPGQLSLETTWNLPADEDNTYVDFYVDDGGLYVKREGQVSQLITAQKLKVTNLVVTLLNNIGGQPAIKTDITVQYRDPIFGTANPVSLSTTTSLRSYSED
jgi:type II secretory pathway pseudopilin PulG